MTPFDQGYNLFMKLAVHAPPDDSPVEAPKPVSGGGKPYNREDVRYMDSSPYEGKQCSTCAHFQKDGTCALVLGTINPNGYCDQYS